MLLALAACSGSLRASETVGWLYEVAVPVADQSTRERQRASGEALMVLLSRLTGLAYVPRTEVVTAALAAPDGYYSQFGFVSAADDGLELVVQFDQGPVLELVREAGLPIWRAQRERVLVWAVLQDVDGRQIVGTTSELPIVAAMKDRARDRGVPLSLPLLDLEDQLAVDPAAVWGRLSQVVDPASVRYGADVLLLGRITPTFEGGWESDWEFWVDGVVVPFAGESLDLAALGVEAVDVLANELAIRRVVHGRQAGQLRLAVSGLQTPADYGALLTYLRGLEFIEQVGVAGVEDGRLWLTLETPAEPDRLLDTFERDRRLFDDQLARPGAADLKLVWRGGG